MRVVKIGGRAQSDLLLASVISKLWTDQPGQCVVVHGGGDGVSLLQRSLGQSPTFVEGRRVTTPADIDILRMSLSGASNKRLVAALSAAGAPAFGISGEDGNLLVARQHRDSRLGAVGIPTNVNVRVLTHLLQGGWLPVISPVATDGEGRAFNVNADDAAAAIAAALSAEELVLVADVEGVLVNGEVAETIDDEGARELIARGAITAGMIAKLDAALNAVTAGVARVRIGDVRAIADSRHGTTVVPARSCV
ncbi:MAG: acetylglutamate kinase [Chloroflexota bacterium]